MRIAFIGVGYFPTRTAGEKNFYLELLPLIRRHVDDVIVLSVNDQEQEMYTQESGSGDISIYNFKRPFHWGDKTRFLRVINNVNCYHHRHGPAQEMIEKFLSLFINMGRIRRIIESHQIDVIYFMDNFGFGMGYTKKRLSRKTVFAAANYDPRGYFYNQLQSMFIRDLDLVVSYTSAYSDILCDLGVKASRIRVIHWGIDPEQRMPLHEDVRKQIRKKHRIENGNHLVLWTGYIQQIQEKDFYFATSVAKQIREKRSDIQFIFCFKPETFKPAYSQVETEGIQVISGAPDFHGLLGSSDLLFSPTYKLASTVSPPLTWTEAMSMGVPVITTKVKGSEEVIENMESGFISDNYNTITEDIITIFDAGINDDIRAKARQKILEKYNLHTIAKNYVSELESVE